MLEKLNCHNTSLTELDLSRNTKLRSLTCPNNKLTTLVVNANLEGIFCSGNHLPLSNLFVFSEIIDNVLSKHLGPQFLIPQTVNTGSEIDFSDQSIFKGMYTQFEVTKDGYYQSGTYNKGIPAFPSDYILIDGKIKFNRPGKYRVIMTNEAIVSRFDFAAVVYAEINIL